MKNHEAPSRSGPLARLIVAQLLYSSSRSKCQWGGLRPAFIANKGLRVDYSTYGARLSRARSERL